MLKLLLFTSLAFAVLEESEERTQPDKPVVIEGDRETFRRKSTTREQEPPPPAAPVYEETESDRPGQHPK